MNATGSSATGTTAPSLLTVLADKWGGDPYALYRALQASGPVHWESVNFHFLEGLPIRFTPAERAS